MSLQFQMLKFIKIFNYYDKGEHIRVHLNIIAQ